MNSPHVAWHMSASLEGMQAMLILGKSMACFLRQLHPGVDTGQ